MKTGYGELMPRVEAALSDAAGRWVTASEIKAMVEARDNGDRDLASYARLALRLVQRGKAVRVRQYLDADGNPRPPVYAYHVGTAESLPPLLARHLTTSAGCGTVPL